MVMWRVLLPLWRIGGDGDTHVTHLWMWHGPLVPLSWKEAAMCISWIFPKSMPFSIVP